MKTLLSLSILLGLASQAHSERPHSDQEGQRPPGLIEIPPGNPSGCMEKLDKFCSTFNDPTNSTILKLEASSKGRSPYAVSLGNAESGVALVHIELQKAKLKAASRFPSDFKTELDKHKYFKLLSDYIHLIEQERSLNSLEQSQLKSKSSELSEIWNQASARVTALSSYRPRHAQSYSLLDEVDRAIWKDEPHWVSAEKQFQEVQFHFIEYLKSLNSIPQETRLRWIQRVSTIRLRVPSSETEADCASGAFNAAYIPAKHEFTVCSGMFLGASDFQMVIAHEIAHSIEPDSERRQSFLGSALFAKLENLRAELCSSGLVDPSSKSFQEFQSPKNLKKLLGELKPWVNPAPSFYKCLLGQSPPQRMDHTYLAKRVKEDVGQQTSLLADRKLFKSLVWSFQQSQEEECVLNESHASEWNNLMPLLFSASYQRSSISDPKDRLQEAIQEAEQIQSQIKTHLVSLGGVYSGDPLLVRGRFSKDISERFADALASAVFARYLRVSISNPQERWSNFLVAAVGRCLEDSCGGPSDCAQTEVEKEFASDPHSEGRQRNKEVMPQTIQDVLGCQKDFKLNECRL